MSPSTAHVEDSPQMHEQECIEYESIYDPSAGVEVFQQRIVSAARERGRLTEDESHELARLLAGRPPPGPESGLESPHYEPFIAHTLQCVEFCLLRAASRRPGFINRILQGAVNQYLYEGSWTIAEVNDAGRRGRSRTRTLGQIQRLPGNPDDPSFLGGTWDIWRGKEQRRVVFSIEIREVAGSLALRPVTGEYADRGRLLGMVLARSARGYPEQVEPSSPLGRWIATLAGSKNIGPHRGYLPLGVFCEAVQRRLNQAGLSHFLLAASRRDPPSRPWHTGKFLEREGDGFLFHWRGLALDHSHGDPDLLEVSLDVQAHARVIGIQPMVGPSELDLP